MDLSYIEKNIIIPGHDKYTPVKKTEAEFIYRFLSEVKPAKTLEIGLGYGRSALYIMAATQQVHTAIDPFQKQYNYHAIKNIESSAYKNLFTHIEDYSHNVLPALVGKGETYDFIFIDGDHKYDGIFIDFYYASLLLNTKGYLLFHDTWMRSTQLVLSFIRSNRNDFTVVDCPLRNFKLLQKTGADNRNGMHFKEFYTTKSLLRYRFINWLNGENNSLVKNIFRSLKDKLK